MGSNPRGKNQSQKRATASTNYKTAPLLQSACKPFWAVVAGLCKITLGRLTQSLKQEKQPL